MEGTCEVKGGDVLGKDWRVEVMYRGLFLRGFSIVDANVDRRGYWVLVYTDLLCLSIHGHGLERLSGWDIQSFAVRSLVFSRLLAWSFFGG